MQYPGTGYPATGNACKAPPWQAVAMAATQQHAAPQSFGFTSKGPQAVDVAGHSVIVAVAEHYRP